MNTPLANRHLVAMGTARPTAGAGITKGKEPGERGSAGGKRLLGASNLHGGIVFGRRLG